MLFYVMDKIPSMLVIECSACSAVCKAKCLESGKEMAGLEFVQEV